MIERSQLGGDRIDPELGDRPGAKRPQMAARSPARRFLDPAGVVERLGDDVARDLVAPEFDQHQRAVGGDGQQVDAPAEAGVFLPTDQHPFVGEELRGGDDHVFQLLFARQLRLGQGLRGGGDFPEVGTDGRGGCGFRRP